jgi:hypothetical protein
MLKSTQGMHTSHRLLCWSPQLPTVHGETVRGHRVFGLLPSVARDRLELEMPSVLRIRMIMSGFSSLTLGLMFLNLWQ